VLLLRSCFEQVVEAVKYALLVVGVILFDMLLLAAGVAVVVVVLRAMGVL
jgi:hypothetical protein